MASQSGTQEKMDASSIVEMEAMDGDESDYETNFTDTGGSTPPQSKGKGDFMEGMQDEMRQNVTSFMWQKGQQRAKQVFNLYANIDLLRPYFDVEPHEVRQRLLLSLIPQKPTSRQTLHRELYGPTMIVLSLIAILLFQMKSSGHTVQEGTLMGSAFGICFGYWVGMSGFSWFLANICNTHISLVQLLSLLGYALFGHCVALLLGTLIHTSHSHMFFYTLWLVFGGLSTLKMVSILIARTNGRTQRLVICGVVAAAHLLFLLYLHFAYHQIVEDISSMIEQPAVPQPGQNFEMVPTPAKMAAADHVQAAVDTVSQSATRLVREVADRPSPPAHIVADSVLARVTSLKPGSKLLNAIAGAKLSDVQ
ncbi:Protein YIPF3 [Lamellibrachia satsuma]|nr:Protein YIPF3 [Lamellibrachia satsuma]